MRTARKGFTLVEILIVVVILGILAAIVVPQFTSASQQAVKGALQTQLSTIESQIELYRVREAGRLPHEDADDPLLNGGDEAAKWGWGIMVSDEYLKDEPFNGYTKSKEVIIGDNATEDVHLISAAEAAAAGVEGWLYDDANGRVWALGFDEDQVRLANEEDYGVPLP
jgi:general secretion pathway protein G